MINPERVESVPQISFVEFKFIPPQEFAKLVLKGYLAMVLFLSNDIFPHHFDLRETNGEYSITILPGKVTKVGVFRFHPQRGTAFDLFDHRRHFDGARQGAQKMNMVFNTTNDNGLAWELGQNSAKVSVQFIAQRLVA